MARKQQKKKRNKKYKPIYTTDGRVDMRTGGRVGFQEGTGVSAQGGKFKAIQNER